MEYFVIATAETHSVRDFVELSFKEVGIDLEWKDTGLDKIGIDENTGRILVKVDQYYFRPTEVAFLLGDTQKAQQKLGWKPKTTLQELCAMMVKEDLLV